MIEPDDFTIWRDNAVTQRFFKALRSMADEAKQAWTAASWDRGNCDEKLLIDLRATATVAEDICEMTFEEMEAKLAKE